MDVVAAIRHFAEIDDGAVLILADATHFGNRRIRGNIQKPRDRHVGRADLDRLPSARDGDARQFQQHRDDGFPPEAPRRHPEHAFVEKDGNDAIGFAVS